MKSLTESLFDKDIVTKELPLEKYMKNFSSDALQRLSVEERNSVFDQLFDSGEQYNAAELRKNPIDLTKTVLIQRRDDLIVSESDYPVKYTFIFAVPVDFGMDIPGYETTFIANLRNSSAFRSSYYWDNETFDRVDKKSTWKGKVSALYVPNSSYSVIANEKWSKEIIDSILAD